MDVGSGATTNGSCSAFTPATLLLTGTLAALGTGHGSWAAGAGGFHPGGAGATAAYRVTYTLRASAPDSVQGTTGAGTVTWEARDAAATASYAAAVQADSPYLYHRLGESSGATAADASGHNRSGTYAVGGATALGSLGAVGGDTALHLAGAGTVTSSASYATPDLFTTEIWFRTTTATGGMLWGIGDGNGDVRYLRMSDDGTLSFRGLLDADDYELSSPAGVPYNDGAWHLAAVSMGPAGVRLLVDGAVVAHDDTTVATDAFSAPWFAGAGTTYAYYDGGSTTVNLTGDLDEFAVYPTQLSDARIAAHYAAR